MAAATALRDLHRSPAASLRWLLPLLDGALFRLGSFGHYEVTGRDQKDTQLQVLITDTSSRLAGFVRHLRPKRCGVFDLHGDKLVRA